VETEHERPGLRARGVAHRDVFPQLTAWQPCKLASGYLGMTAEDREGLVLHHVCEKCGHIAVTIASLQGERDDVLRAELRALRVTKLLEELAAGCPVADALFESTLGMVVRNGDVTVDGGEHTPITEAALRKWAVRVHGLIAKLPWTTSGYPSLREKIAAALAAARPETR
jgi:hypothetical protein